MPYCSKSPLQRVGESIIFTLGYDFKIEGPAFGGAAWLAKMGKNE
jgi:hypothetical protein